MCTVIFFSVRRCDMSLSDLCNAVCIEERSAEVNDGLSSPVHCKSGSFSNDRNSSGFKIFLVSLCNKAVNILSLKHNSHSFLRFGNCKLCAVKTVIFLSNLVKVNRKTVCKLADSNAYAACAEVIAALYHSRNSPVSEKSLYFSFCGGITLLDLCAAGLDRIHSMSL